MKKSSIPLAAILLLFLVTASVHGNGGPDDAEAALRALDRAYVEAWKERGTARQEAALLPLFAEDAVIIPGGGTEPRRGVDELRSFWFPEDSPPTNVRTFEHTVDGLEVSDRLGVVHGRSRLEFEYSGDVVGQEGNFLIVARREDGGRWRITQMIWNNRTLP